MSNKTLKLILLVAVIAIFTTTIFAFQTSTRIRFAKGKNSTTISDTIGDSGKKDYIIRGNKGRVLSALVSSDCESVQIIVIDNGTGNTISETPSTEYQDELPGTDDYIIRVQNSDSTSCKFTLKVGLK